MSKAVRVGMMALGGMVAVLSMTACDTTFGDKKADEVPEQQPVSSSQSGSHKADAPNPKKSGSASASSSGNKNSNGNGHMQIVSFEVVQQPRCASGTTKYETPAVPLKIKWKVTGATGVALSVDDPHRVGSYGNYGVEETMEFTFSCGGAVGSTETHKYTIYTIGGSGEKKSKTLTVSTKVLERGTPV